ncbi:MAG: hypothetical protein WD738_20415 [Pirellulales bacterium]
MPDTIEIFVSDVNDVEARVFARYVGAAEDRAEAEPIVLRGTLRGPYCAGSRTLPAEIAFRDLGPQQIGLAEALVPDPCTWSAELPHLYQADVEARQGERMVAEFHGTIGLRRATQNHTK